MSPCRCSKKYIHNYVLLWVYSFNLLSTKHETDGKFKHCPEEDMEDRKSWITDVLLEKMRAHEAPVIFCLQEVSRKLAEYLQYFFKQYGYLMEVTSTADESMGEAIVYKTTEFSIVETCRHNDRKYRREHFIFARLLPLKGRHSNDVFTVGSCHLPRNHDHPVRHVAQTMEMMQNFRRYRGNTKGVLAGDFNMHPDSEAYNVITGRKDYGNQTNTGNNRAIMNSAYYQYCQSEPRSTMVGKEETLDYIFLTPGVNVVKCDEIKTIISKEGWCPYAEYPSDHAIIGAKVCVPIYALRQSCVCPIPCNRYRYD